MSLYRHNGLPVAVGVIAMALFSLGRVYRRRVLALGLTSAVVYLLLTQGVFRWIGVTPIPAFLRAQVPVHQTASLVAAGVPFGATDTGTLASIKPVELWRDNYRCMSVNLSLHELDRSPGDPARPVCGWKCTLHPSHPRCLS
jgi:hypothetical protein